MKKHIAIFLFLFMFMIISCQKILLTKHGMQDKEIKNLTVQLIYGKEEEVRVKALNDLTRAGLDVRYHAIDELVKAQLIYEKEEEVRVKALNDLTRAGPEVRYHAIDELLMESEGNPGLFPRGNYEENEKKPSLLMEIIDVDYLNENMADIENEAEYVKPRLMHLHMLNRMVIFSIRKKLYYEAAKIFYQKYFYGTLWSQKSLKNRSAVTEFNNARNAGIAYLKFMSGIVEEERTKQLIRRYLDEIDSISNEKQSN